jgi:putative transposase
MPQDETRSHTTWDCKDHVVFIPKYRRKALYKERRQHLGEVFRSLAEHKECRIEKGHLMPDHVHMLIAIPPKYSVAQVIGFLKGKAAIHIARTYTGRRKNYTGHHFWARGYYVTTLGRDEAPIRAYIQRQEKRISVSIKWDFGSRMPP